MIKRYSHHIVLAVVFLFVYSWCFDVKLDLNGDNATYISLARNIADGLGYSTINPDGVKPTSTYPPGYPALLSAFMFLGIDSLIFFKVINGILLFSSIMLLFSAMKRATGDAAATFSALVLCCFCTPMLQFSYIVMSEMLFLFLSAVSIYSLFRQSQTEGSAFYKSVWFWLAVVSAVAAYHVRTMALALLFAVVVFYAFRKEWRQTIASAASIVALMLPWIMRNSAMGLESRYFGMIMKINPWRPEAGTVQTFGDLVEKMLKNFDETVLRAFPDLLFPWLKINYDAPVSGMIILCGLIILAIVCYGAWKSGSLRWLLLAYLAANIGLFMLWHGGNGNRYVAPLAPIIYICFWTGVTAILTELLKVKVKKLQLLYLLLVLPCFGPLQAQHNLSNRPVPAAYRNYFTAAQDINKQMPKGTVVACRKPEMFNYYAPHTITIYYKFTQNPLELIGDLLNKRCDLVILDMLGYSSTGLYLYPAIKAYPSVFKPVAQYKQPDTYILMFDREEAAKIVNNNAESAE